MQRILERAWELGWRAALKKAGVPEDDPTFRHPPKFQSSGTAPSFKTGPPSAPGPFEAHPVVDDVVEAVTLQAVPKACPVDPTACPTNPKASRAEPEVLPEVAAAQMEIDCNAEAAAP